MQLISKLGKTEGFNFPLTWHLIMAAITKIILMQFFMAHHKDFDSYLNLDELMPQLLLTQD